MNNKRPTTKLNALLRGETSWEDADASIASWAQYFIHQAAEDVLSRPMPERKAMIEKMPEHVRHKVKSEVLRIWEYKRSTPAK